MARKTGPRAEAYIMAARERGDDAEALFTSGQYGGSIWVSGVALEALFRGYHLLRSDQLNTGHQLKLLYKESRFANYVSPAKANTMAQHIGTVSGYWQHRFRYDSESAILRSLKLPKQHGLKKPARSVVNAAREIINHGARRWPK